MNFAAGERGGGPSGTLGSALARIARSDFLRHGALVFASSMLVNVAGYAYHAGVSRLLGVQDYGALYALIALLPLAGIPSTIMCTVIVKFSAEFRAVGDDQHVHALFIQLSKWLGGIALVALAAVISCSSAIAGFLRVEPVTIAPTAFLIGITLVLPPLRAVLQGTQDFRQFAISSFLEGVLKAALGIALVIAGFSVVGAIGGYALGSFVALLYTWVVLQRRYAAVPATELRIDWSRLLQTLWGAAISTLAVVLLSYCDVLLVRHFMSATEAGLYASVSLGGKILFFLAAFVPMVMMPKATHRAARSESPLPMFLVSLAVLLLFSCAGLMLFYFAPALILRSLVGAKFLSAAHLLFGYGVAMVLLAAMSLTASYKIALHRFDFAVPFMLIVVGELAAITLHHPTLSAVVWTLIIGNSIGFAMSLYGIRRWEPSIP